MLLKCFAGCSFDDVLAALRARGLLDRHGPGFRPYLAEAARREAQERAEEEKRNRQARAIWAEAQPIMGTLAERYLRARAIVGPLPGTLRFHSRCWHASGRRFPAMVAAVERRGDLIAIHRTYLAEPGVKAAAEPVRAMLGPTAGGAVRSGRPARC